MNSAELTSRARLYQALAEALAEPAGWLSGPGPRWPLFTAAVEITHTENDPAMSHAVVGLAEIPCESLSRRRARYEAIFSGQGRPHLWLYESLARDGRLLGPCTFAVWSVYKAAKLAVAGAELPDHASVELAFLAYLLEQENVRPTESAQRRRVRRLFVKRHAGQWLPALGDALAQTGDRVYEPIGLLLSAVIRREMRSGRLTCSRAERRLPALTRAEGCNLCSFCVQVCPTHALAIQETDAATTLALAAGTCVSCAQCVQVCPTKALHLELSPPEDSCRVLHQSPRARCPGCGQPTVSQAELEAVSNHIGTPIWLNYCLECRSLLLEETP